MDYIIKIVIFYGLGLWTCTYLIELMNRINRKSYLSKGIKFITFLISILAGVAMGGLIVSMVIQLKQLK